LFGVCKQYVPVFAVLDSNFPGKVYVDSIDAPTTAIVLALTRWAYIDGDIHNTNFLNALPDFIQDVVTPLYRQLDMNWFELYAPQNECWIPALDDTLAPLSTEMHWESTYVLDSSAYQQLRQEPALPHGIHLRNIDLPIIQVPAMASQLIPSSLLEKKAVGYELVQGDRVIAVCRSNGLQAEREFMVDVRTFRRKDRRRGYARLTATALIDHALKEDVSPLWETMEDNIASRRLAESLGYVKAESYPVYAMQLDRSKR
jgi:RimJ/RimL family protein N-acetyltransferase